MPFASDHTFMAIWMPFASSFPNPGVGILLRKQEGAAQEPYLSIPEGECLLRMGIQATGIMSLP